MNLRHLGNQELLEATRDLAHQERALGTRFLWHVREVERRRLHLADGSGSLHEYLVKELKYSDGSASRRIRSMALLKELPEIEAALQDGRLSMTTVSATQSFFRREAEGGRKVYTPEEKREVLNNIENKSREECERILFKLSPQSVPKERQRTVSDEETELRIIVARALLGKLARVRGIVTGKRRKSQVTNVELLEEMTEFYLVKNDPVRKFERRAKREMANRPSTEKSSGRSEGKASPEKLLQPNEAAASPEKLAVGNTSNGLPQESTRRNATADDRFQLFVRDGYRCAFQSSKGGVRCEARLNLQPDHRHAWAKGGVTKVANMRWLCPAHNQWEALRTFGSPKMGEYVPSLR